MSNNFSYSRVSCFEGCQLKYLYNYVKGFKAEGEDNQLQTKGLTIHEAFERYKIGDTAETLMKYIEDGIKKYDLKEQYNFEEAVNRFIVFREQFFNPKLNEGFKVFHEQWTRGTLAGVPIVGALDTILESDKELYIVDFKSGKSADTKSYQKQLMLYAYLKGAEKKWSIAETAKRIKLYVFFPLAETAKKYDTVEKRALFCLKQIMFTEEDLEANTQEFIENINTIQSTNFNQITTDDANVSFACNWCWAAGTLPKDEIDFKGCPKSYAAGWRQPRNLKVRKN